MPENAVEFQAWGRKAMVRKARQTLHTGDRSKGSENNCTNCCYCSGKHALENCKIISEVGARKAHLRKTAHCFNYLISSHRVFKCRSAKQCEIYGSKHHVSIWQNKGVPTKPGPPIWTQIWTP